MTEESNNNRSENHSALSFPAARLGIVSGNSFRCLAVLALLLCTGCNAFGNRKLVQQLQGENEKLLAEFRTQRDRAEELARANRQLEDRVASTEKELAMQYQAGSGRLTQRLGGNTSSNSSSSSQTNFSGAFGSSSASASPGFGTPSSLGPAPGLSGNGLQWKPR